MAAFLTADEIHTLTGYKRPADQVRWLQDRGISHVVNARGKPVVASDVLNKRTLPEVELGPIP